MSEKTKSGSHCCRVRTAKRKRRALCEPRMTWSGANYVSEWFFALTRLGIILKSLFEYIVE